MVVSTSTQRLASQARRPRPRCTRRLYNVWLNGFGSPLTSTSRANIASFRLKAGDNHLVVQGGGGADAIVKTFTTAAEVRQRSDAITPHLIVDRVDPQLFIGAAVLNLKDVPLAENSSGR